MINQNPIPISFSNIMVFMQKWFLLAFLIGFSLLSGCSSKPNEQVNASPSSADYIENKGSDTIVNLALAWAEAYQKINPAVRISVTGGGSGTGLAALINGTVDIANASRMIKPEELEEAKNNGMNPQEFVIARDAIAVIVNPENPVTHLTLEQVSRIYTGEINNWLEVGGEDRPIVRLSRETNSGTHVYFLESVIRLGDSNNKAIFSASTLLLPSSEGIIAEVSSNPNAIGYDGLGYITDTVKVVGISSLSSPDVYIIPSINTVIDGSYVVSRDLYMYTRDVPQGMVKAYLDWIYTPEAQAIVSKLGFVPVTGN
jgi:phosphate transport system substrate-binding protein